MWRRPVPCGLKAGLKAKIHSGILLQIHSKLREVRDVSDQNARSNSGLGIIVFCPDDLKECTPFSTYIYWYVNDMLTSEGRNVVFSLCNTWAFANGSGKLYPFRCNISTATKGVATKVGRFFHFFTEDRVSLTDLNRSISLPWIKRSRACLFFFFFSRFVHEQITKHQQSKKWNKHGFWMDQVFCLWFLFFLESSANCCLSSLESVWNITPPRYWFLSGAEKHGNLGLKKLLGPSSFRSHVLWSKVEHIARRCHHPQHSDDSHCSGVEGDAPREASVSRSNWAQNPESGTSARQLNHRWCWDTWRSRVLSCWIASYCRIHKERSGSCNESWHWWHSYTEMFWGKDPLQPDRNFQLCFPLLQSTGFGRHQRLGDAHWGRCLCRMHIFDEHQHGWVCDSHWDWCL